MTHFVRPIPVLEAPTMYLIFVALILLGTSFRWYSWACEDFANRKVAQAWFFLLGSFVWMGLAACLALATTM